MSEPSSNNANAVDPVEFLLRRMQRHRDFPVLSETIQTLNRLTASDENSVAQLTDVIVRDFALTNKVLKVVNSAYYGGFAGKVGTISRALVVLGIEPIRSLAASLLLFEHLGSHRNAARIKALIARSVFAALMARELSPEGGIAQPEQAFLAAMFHNLGELLVAYYLPEEDEAIRALCTRGELSPREAEKCVLNVDLEHLGIAIGRHWGFPVEITHAMKQGGHGAVKTSGAPTERLARLASFANAVTTELVAGHKPDAEPIARLCERFSEVLSVDVMRLTEGLQEVRSEYRVLAAGLTEQRGAPDEVRVLAGERPKVEPAPDDDLEDMALPSESDDADDPIGIDPEPILLEGLQEITAMLAGGDSIHDVAQVVLETLYRALSLNRVALCLRDSARRQYAGRLGFGADIAAYLKQLRISEAYQRDVFHVALDRKTDVHIADLAKAASGHGIPDWYHVLAPNGSLLFLPVVVQGVPVGFLLAEHGDTGGLALAPTLLRLVRALRDQFALGLQIRRSQ
jgi:eukaryotic-like serine/threonine-protein kinase